MIGRVARALDLKSSNLGFKSGTGHLLVLFSNKRSAPLAGLFIAYWSTSCHLGSFKTSVCYLNKTDS